MIFKSKLSLSILFILLLLILGIEAQICRENLPILALYRFDEIIGGKVVDGTGTPFIGTDLNLDVTGSAFYTTNKGFHYGYEWFNDGLTVLPTEENLDIRFITSSAATKIFSPIYETKQFSMETWFLVKDQVMPAANHDAVAVSLGINCTHSVFSLRFEKTEINNLVKMYPDLYSPIEESCGIDPIINLEYGDQTGLFHIVVTYDQSETSSEYPFGIKKTYINSILVDESVVKGWNVSPDTPYKISIFNSQDGGAPMFGSIYHLSFYSSALTQEQITGLYTAGVTLDGFCSEISKEVIIGGSIASVGALALISVSICRLGKKIRGKNPKQNNDRERTLKPEKSTDALINNKIGRGTGASPPKLVRDVSDINFINGNTPLAKSPSAGSFGSFGPQKREDSSRHLGVGMKKTKNNTLKKSPSSGSFGAGPVQRQDSNASKLSATQFKRKK